MPKKNLRRLHPRDEHLAWDGLVVHGDSVAAQIKAAVQRKLPQLPPAIAEHLKSYMALQEKDVAGLSAAVAVNLTIPQFVPSGTAKEAEKFLMDNDIVDVADFGNITDMELINDWSKVLFDSVKEFSELRKNQQFTGSAQAQADRLFKIESKLAKQRYIEKLGYTEAEADAAVKRNVTKLKVNGFAWSNPREGVKGIAFNEAYEDGFQEIIDDIAKLKYWAEGSEDIKYVVNHELGHQLDDLLMLSQRCTHFSGEQKCKAFPSGIPDNLWSGDNLHRTPYEGLCLPLSLWTMRCCSP